MRTTGIIHADLNAALTRLRHTDLMAVADSGLPVPPSVPVVDLGVLYGIPSFLEVLDAVLEEITVEAAWASEDVTTVSPEMATAITTRTSVQLIDHDLFKRRIGDCAFVVRTGEATPFANLLLRAGVPWFRP